MFGVYTDLCIYHGGHAMFGWSTLCWHNFNFSLDSLGTARHKALCMGQNNRQEKKHNVLKLACIIDIIIA